MGIEAVSSITTMTNKLITQQIENNLKNIAKHEAISVDQLVTNAKDSDNPTPLQKRIVNMAERLERLKS